MKEHSRTWSDLGPGICYILEISRSRRAELLRGIVSSRGLAQLKPAGKTNSSVWDVFFVLFLSMAVVPTLGIMCIDWFAAMGIISDSLDTLKQIRMVTAVSAQEAALFFLTWGVVKSEGGSLASLGFRWQRPGADVALGIGIGGLLVGINLVGEHVSRFLFSLFMTDSRVMELLLQENAVTGKIIAQGQEDWARISMAVLIICVAPIVEEAFFRGYAYNVCKARWGTTRAVLLSSLLFAGVHMYIIHFLPVFLLGVILALVYQWRNTLVTPIVAHAMTNLIVAVALYYF